MAAAPMCCANGNIIQAWEPLFMVLPKSLSSAAALTTIATRELSNLDRLHDFYPPWLFYYRMEATASGDGVADAGPAPRLLAALQELLLHYPCAAGVLLQKEADYGRLELRYPAVGDGDGDADGRKLRLDESGYSFGVPFRVAHAAVALADLGDLSLPHPAADALYPPPPSADASSKGRRFVMAFQITYFTCGGFCIGFTCNHIYGDGHTFATFVQNMCSIARGAGLANPPHLTQRNALSLKPRDPPAPLLPLAYIASRKGIADELGRSDWGTPECFKFPMEALQALRAHVAAGCRTGHCSRAFALLAVLWSAHARVHRQVHKLPANHVLELGFPVDVRRRSVPGISKNHVGNAVVRCQVVATLEELCEVSLAEIVDKIQGAMAALDPAECVQSIVDLLELKIRDGLISSMFGLNMPIHTGLPSYDTDCGWGGLVYVGLASKIPKNVCLILGHSKAPTWNVLVVLPSLDEKACFNARILECLKFSTASAIDSA